MGECLSRPSSSEMNAPVVIQATARHTATVFFMHGLGDTGHGWQPVFQAIKAPHVKYVLPHAPVQAVTLNMGMQMPSWFDIKGLSPGADEDEAGIKKATKDVHSWIEAEMKQGIPSDRILIGGFSQGGGLAVYSAVTYDKPLAGVLALSCWLPLHQQLPGDHSVNLNVPVLQCHGLADPLIFPPIGELSASYLKAFDKNHTFKTYQNMAHGSCDEEIRDMKEFIAKVLPPK